MNPLPQKTDFRLSLFAKFSLGISLCVLLLLSLMGSVFIDILGKALINERKQAAGTLAQITAETSAFHIQNYLLYMLDDNTNLLQAGTSSNLEILSVLVLSMDDRKLNPSGTGISQITVPQEFWHVVEKPILFKFSNGTTEKIGKLRMIFSLETLYKKVRQTRTTLILILVVSILILNGVLILLLKIIIIRPLKQLGSSAEKITQGDFDIKLAPQSQDEIGVLSTTFLTMAANLKESIEKINLSEEKYRGIFENSQAGIFQTTAQGTFISANEALAKTLGYRSKDELISSVTDIGKQLYGNEATRENILKQLNENNRLVDHESRAYKKDGSTV